MTELMDRALEALDVLEDVGEAGERLCMQSWGVLGSYVTNIQLFQAMMHNRRATLHADRDRLSHETEVYYG